MAGGARRWRLVVAVDGDGSTHTEDNWIAERHSALAAAADGDGSTHARGWSGLGIFRVDDGWIEDFSLNFLGYMRGCVGGSCERRNFFRRARF
jgi:hypothetical protein